MAQQGLRLTISNQGYGVQAVASLEFEVDTPAGYHLHTRQSFHDTLQTKTPQVITKDRFGTCR